MELKKIGVLSLGKIAGLFGVVYGLVSGILMSILYSQAKNIPEVMQEIGYFSTIGYWAVLLLPLINGIGYFIGGIITAFVYNIIARKVGGVKIEFKK
ncbi:MAG: hypothetical protein ABIG37_00145 [Nanoarchaeota archaeon]|nr:DUF3566 domain-containing protein [Nanoarchaeota archaeon]